MTKKGALWHLASLPPRTLLRDYAGILLGSLLTAAGLNWFLVPARIAAGGVSGLATVIHHLVGGPVGLLMLMFNVPLFLAGLRWLGAHFGLKTLWGTVTLSVLTDLLAPYLHPLTHDPLLAALYGGALTGVGVGITFRFGGSTGGTDIGAALIGRYTPLTTGQALMGIDGAVIMVAGLAFGPELALYALLAVFVASRAIDLVQEGLGYAKVAYIISDVPDEIANGILYEMQRGVTALHGAGKFTGQERDVLFVIVSRSEVTTLKELVHRHDPRAFVVIHDAREVLGEGFDERFRR
ncbi:MAG: YitT family protein [Limnochordales bacterium]|nr:YitT family protein [Limnochordales bacterium]